MLIAHDYCWFIPFLPSRVTKDKQGLQDPQALLVQEAHLGTQEKMAPEGCQEYLWVSSWIVVLQYFVPC